MEAYPSTPMTNPVRHTEISPGGYQAPYIKVLFRSLHGDVIKRFVNPGERLVDVQKPIAQECGYNFPDRIARLVKPNGHVITDLLDFPFEDCQEGDVYNIVFNTLGAHEGLPAARVTVEFEFLSGLCEAAVVSTQTRLRDVQRLLLDLAGHFLPDTASIRSPLGQIFCQLNDLPFVNANEGDVFSVMIDAADDPSDDSFFNLLRDFDIRRQALLDDA
eukprot:9927223-Karenia_brevis.AAC.1